MVMVFEYLRDNHVMKKTSINWGELLENLSKYYPCTCREGIYESDATVPLILNLRRRKEKSASRPNCFTPWKGALTPRLGVPHS
jgi:hypothetical protein